MSDTKKESGKRAADAPVEGGKKKPPIMIIAIVAVVVMAVAIFMVGKVSAKSGGKHTEKPKKAEPGPVMPLDEFLVNLSDAGGDHFLKITVNLELDKEKGKSEESMKEKVPVIRDAVLSALSDKSRDDIGPAAGRDKLKAAIRKKVNEALGEDDIHSVYFTNFVTQ